MGLWARNPFTYFEPSYDNNISQWSDDALNFPVASLRLRQYEKSSGVFNDVEVSNLPEPITITFPMQESFLNASSNNQVDLVCVWWNETEHEWSSAGCSVPLLDAAGVVQCKCTHLTNFAVRLKRAAAQNAQIFNSIASEKFGEELLNNPVALVFVISVCLGSLVLFLVGVWYHRHKREMLRQRVLLLHSEFEAIRLAPLRVLKVENDELRLRTKHDEDDEDDGDDGEEGTTDSVYASSEHASAVSFVTVHDDAVRDGIHGSTKESEYQEKKKKMVNNIGLRVSQENGVGGEQEKEKDHQKDHQKDNQKDHQKDQKKDQKDGWKVLRRGTLDRRVSECMTTIDDLLEVFAIDQGKGFIHQMERTMSTHNLFLCKNTDKN